MCTAPLLLSHYFDSVWPIQSRSPKFDEVLHAVSLHIFGNHIRVFLLQTQPQNHHNVFVPLTTEKNHTIETVFGNKNR